MGSYSLAQRLQEALKQELQDYGGDDLCFPGPSSDETTLEPSPHFQGAPLAEADPTPPDIGHVTTLAVGVARSVNPEALAATGKSARVKRRNCEQSRKNTRQRLQVSKQPGGEAPEFCEAALKKYTTGVDPLIAAAAIRQVRVAKTGYVGLRPKAVKKEKGKREGVEQEKREGVEQEKREGVEQEKREGVEQEKREGVEQGKEYSLKELRDEYQFEYRAWDGGSVCQLVKLAKPNIRYCRSALPVSDGGEGKYLLIIMAGHPDKWESVNKEAMDCCQEARERIDSDAQKTHPRGAFITLCSGFSHGRGRTKPMNCKQSETNAPVVEDLNKQLCFRRIAGFQSCKQMAGVLFPRPQDFLAVFRTWAPKLYDYYDEKLGRLLKKDSSLRRPFRSIFPTATYNMGPQTVCVPHMDCANLPFGYCAITALGNYDPEKGGHLVIWECKLILEFPPGSTILIPSAILTHFNLPIAEHEVRYSFTQYAAGSLFRWVDNNFKTAEKHLATLSVEEREERELADRNRWQFGLGLLPTIS
jgi:hypothetical protein